MAFDMVGSKAAKEVHPNLAEVSTENSIRDGEVRPPAMNPTKFSKLSMIFMVIFSGIAIGTDAFNVAIVGNIELLLDAIYPGLLTDSLVNRLSNAFMVGMIIGMLVFGFISDKIGRKSGAIFTTLILTVGIALSAGASGTSDLGMIWMLVIARGIAGVGAGGEYPVAGPGAAEATDESGTARKHRGFLFALLADVMPCLGFVFAGIVPLLLLLCFHQEERHYEAVWRLSLGLALLPPLTIFYFRYRMAVSTAVRKSSLRKQKVPLRFYWLALRRYWKGLLGSGLTWFLYNYISYPFGIFSSTIATRVGVGDSITKNIGWGTLINCFYIPGALVGGVLSDRIGRRRTMTLGFATQACFGFILGGCLGKIETITPLFIVMYGIFLAVGEMGPGATVICVASEIYPTSIRGQAMGLTATISKAGGAIGTSVFKPILSSWGEDEFKGNQAVFLIGSGFAMLGAIIAWFCVPDVDKRLESEDEAWKRYLAENGCDFDWGDVETVDPKGVHMDTVRT